MVLGALPNARIQVPISQVTAVGTFNDALYFTAAEFAALTGPQLVAMITDRVTTWVQSVASPPVPLAQTFADILADAGTAFEKVNSFAAVLATPPWNQVQQLNKLRAKLAAIKAAGDAVDAG